VDQDEERGICIYGKQLIKNASHGLLIKQKQKSSRPAGRIDLACCLSTICETPAPEPKKNTSRDRKEEGRDGEILYTWGWID
jgi:hypothetical protein